LNEYKDDTCFSRLSSVTQILGDVTLPDSEGADPETDAAINSILGKSMLKIRCTRIARMSMSSYVGCLRNERIIGHGIVERGSNQNHAGESR